MTAAIWCRMCGSLVPALGCMHQAHSPFLRTKRLPETLSVDVSYPEAPYADLFAGVDTPHQTPEPQQAEADWGYGGGSFGGGGATGEW
jgi:hypothetical protein